MNERIFKWFKIWDWMAANLDSSGRARSLQIQTRIHGERTRDPAFPTLKPAMSCVEAPDVTGLEVDMVPKRRSEGAPGDFPTMKPAMSCDEAPDVTGLEVDMAPGERDEGIAPTLFRRTCGLSVE